MECTDNEKEFIYLIIENRFDIIFSDFSLAGFDGLTAVRLHNEICLEVPFIYVSGSIGFLLSTQLCHCSACSMQKRDIYSVMYNSQYRAHIFDGSERAET